MGNTLETLRRKLTEHHPQEVELAPEMKQAAVAAIVRERAGTMELLLIERAEHPDDPWSGHMAMPGGRVDATDDSALVAAIRETREEVGIDLEEDGQLIGALSHTAAIAHGRAVPLVILPFVFEVLRADELRLDPDEVQDAVWVPIEYLLNPDNRTTMQRRYFGVSITLPCYDIGGRTLWGLTLRMLDELLALL